MLAEAIESELALTARRHLMSGAERTYKTFRGKTLHRSHWPATTLPAPGPSPGHGC